MKSSGSSIVILFALVFALTLAGCGFTPDKPDLLKKGDAPEEFSSSGQADARSDWWRAFGDDTLNSLVNEALSANLDILATWTRLDQAAAARGLTAAQVWPSLTASGAYSESNPASIMTDPTTITLSANYEIDLWGRVGAAIKAADADLKAGMEDMKSASITLTANVALAYFDLKKRKARLDLLAKQKKTAEKYLELVKLRFDQGQAAAAEVLQQKQQVQGKESEIILEKTGIQTAEHALLILLGKGPHGKLPEINGPLPPLPEMPDAGLPLELLKKRPDVRAAELRVIAANERVGEAIAKRLPTLGVRFSYGGSGDSFPRLFSEWIRTVAASASAPLFDGGMRKSEEERTRAALEEKLTSYRKTVLTAFKEVEDALAGEKGQASYMETVGKRLITARKNLDATRTSYANGAGSYLAVLAALTALEQLETAELESRQAALLYRINLCRALGGDWIVDTSKRRIEAHEAE